MIDCFIPFESEAQVAATEAALREEACVGQTVRLTSSPFATRTLREIAQCARAPYTLLYMKTWPLSLGPHALERMEQAAEASGAAWVYADHYKRLPDGTQQRQPVIDYQVGSIRDDFDFGSLILLRTAALQAYFDLPPLGGGGAVHPYQFAGLYDLRLYLSRTQLPLHLDEYLYTEVEDDTRLSGQRQFDYVDPRNRSRQIEMERAATRHLRQVGAYLSAGEWEAAPPRP